MPGIGAIAPQQGLQAFERALRRKAVQLAVLPADWPKLLSQFARGAEPPVLTDLAQQARVDGASQPLEDSSRLELLRHMEETPPQTRRAFLVTYMREQASKVLGLDPALALDPQQPLHELGLDSLMAIELRNALNKAVGRSLPATLLFNYPTIEGLATYLAQEVFHLSEDAAPARSRSPDDAPDQLLTDIQHLSADEVEALLAEELAAVEVLVGGK
jgi:acyl carrier protein